MPKLNKSQVKEVAKSEAWNPNGFKLLPEGRYAGRLQKVEERQGKEYPYWSWWFTQIHDEEGETYGGTQFHTTSLSPKAAGGLKATFEAMGYSLDSDTDEMIGEWAVLYVSQEIQAQGAKAGQMVNRVTGLGTFDPGDWEFDPDAVPADRVRGVEVAGTGRRADSF